MAIKTEDAKEDPGDDSGIMRVHLRWCGTIEEATTGDGPPLGHIYRRDDGVWELVFSVRRSPTRRQRFFAAVSVDVKRPGRWLIVKLAPGVWDVPESIHFEGQFHGFVTLIGVPDPAPWE